MDIIKEIGSYAGFAAVVGLGVLSALYFSQARDLKRLREWAGRAPDREPTPVVPQRSVVATPVAKPQPAAKPIPGGTPPKPAVPGARPGTPPPAVPKPPGVAGVPAGSPLPAQASAAGAAPAVAGAGPAVTPKPAGEPANGSDADSPTSERPAVPQPSGDTVIYPPPDPESDEIDAVDEEADAPSEEHEAISDEVDALPAEPAAPLDPDSEEFKPEDLWEGDQALRGSGEDFPARPPAAPPRAPVSDRPPASPAGSGGAIIPPYKQSRPGGPARAGNSLMSSPRRAVMLVGGAILAAVVLGFGVVQLTGGDDDSGSPATKAPTASSNAKEDSAAKPAAKASGIDPASVTVAVLNGTTVPGLARQLGDKIEAQGFKLGNVTNNPDQQRAESVVMFATGSEKEAAEVGRRMKIAQREPIDPESQALGGDASVVVIAGQNLQ